MQNDAIVNSVSLVKSYFKTARIIKQDYAENAVALKLNQDKDEIGLNELYEGINVWLIDNKIMYQVEFSLILKATSGSINNKAKYFIVQLNNKYEKIQVDGYWFAWNIDPRRRDHIVCLAMMSDFQWIKQNYYNFEKIVRCDMEKLNNIIDNVFVRIQYNLLSMVFDIVLFFVGQWLIEKFCTGNEQLSSTLICILAVFIGGMLWMSIKYIITGRKM
ncbi:MAG: hypothetical protein LBM73_01650 [Candidatus Nomurabacteria bacterium]|jgi:ABC-type multidrug transport system fused ATPase/permease subunit|nr:hypothetical protein [Candidatus Nomurabacteria bacterium]